MGRSAAQREQGGKTTKEEGSPQVQHALGCEINITPIRFERLVFVSVPGGGGGTAIYGQGLGLE